MRVLSRLFRRRFLEALTAAHDAGELQFFGEHAELADPASFRQWLAPLRSCEWVVYAKRPFAGPKQVLEYLSRYTHRVAISNHRLLAFDDRGVTFRWKDYRAKGRTRYKTMTLAAGEFIRRFLLHVLPTGFHRIRHYGLLANAGRKQHLALARELLKVPAPPPAESDQAAAPRHRPSFAGTAALPMVVIEILPPAPHPRTAMIARCTHPPSAPPSGSPSPARVGSPASCRRHVCYRNRLPDCRHRPPCQGDLQRCGSHRGAGTVATNHAPATQTPIAPRRC